MRFNNVFPKAQTFLAVIHCRSSEQSLRNVAYALNEGADGVFLINHEISVSQLLVIYDAVCSVYREAWIGLNMLGYSASTSLDLVPRDASGLWCDDSGIRENAHDPIQRTKHAWEIRRRRASWHGLYFGGVAFKGQTALTKPFEMAALAAPFMDVVTTSGSATGIAPDVEKIRGLRLAVGKEKPIAIASGVTSKNVRQFHDFSPIVYLVATGISDTFDELNPGKISDFARECA